MEVRLVRYPAGVINTWRLRVVSGCVMEHGATAEADVTVVFITNKPFEIPYL